MNARTVENSSISLIPLQMKEPRENFFALYKLSLYEYIDQAFGWDEDFQRARFEASYGRDEFVSVTTGKVSVGYLVLRNTRNERRLALLLLHPDHRDRGIGRSVMNQLMSCALESRRALTLSCFISNRRAMQFYQNLGFALIAKDEYFMTFQYPKA